MGKFALTDLDPELKFRLLAVAPGHTPAYSARLVDPAAGPVTLTLSPHDLDTRDPALVFKGRVLDEGGQPVPQAVVEPQGFRKGGRGQYGGLTGFTPLAVTDATGEFRLGVPEPGLELSLSASAPFKAPRKFNRLPAGPKSHDLTLLAGVTVTGRVVKDGRPLAGVAVGLAQKDRNVETFLGEFQGGTDGKGVFRIPNVPPADLFGLYGKMESLKARGALGLREVRTGASGAELDVGDLAVQPGFRLTGRVVLSDGKPVPAGTRLLLGREDAWDTQQAVAGPDGSFAFEGLPAERYSLSASVPGYHPSPKNASLDLLNGFGLLGAVRGDTEGLRLLLEPGPAPQGPRQFDQKLIEEHHRRKGAPLRGAPGP
jgi:hypothetical protein